MPLDIIDTNIVGIIIINKQDNISTIKSIAVATAYRKIGIGKRLIQYTIDTLKLNSLEAETDDDAVGFYRSCGFQIEDLGYKYKSTRRYNCLLNFE